MKARKLVSVLLVSILSLTMLPAAAYGSARSSIARFSMGKDGYFGRFSLGKYHSAVVITDGSLKTWGYNLFGQLGLKNNVDTNVPSAVPDLFNVCAVSLGDNHSAAITTDGSLYTWGYNLYGQLGLGNNIATNKPSKVGSIKNVTAVSLGDDHSAAVTTDGNLYTWGYGSEGRLGLGNSLSANTPQKVSIPNSVYAISLGGAHSAAITADRSLYTWGYNAYGQLGHGDTVSVTMLKKVNGLSNVIAVSLGANHSAAITADGSLYTWGSNSHGQLGHGDTENLSVPKKVEALNKVVGVSLGVNHSAAVTADGSLYTWGSNNYGQLGRNGTIDSNVPGKVDLSHIKTGEGEKVNVKAVNLGGYHSAAVLSDGKMISWGHNRYGQLGLGHSTDKTSPVLLTLDIVPFTQVIVTVQTGAVSDITTNSAWVKGSSFKVQNAEVTGTGVVWSKYAYISGNMAVAAGKASPFDVELKNLSPNTKYYYQAYVNTTVGGNRQYRGEIMSFRTKPDGPTVTGVKIMSPVYVLKDSTVTLPYAVQPYNAANQNVKWKTSNKNIATVDASGKVTGMKTGSAVITVTTVDGNKTASCIVNVVSKAIALKTLKITPGSAMRLNTGIAQQVYPTLNPANATGIVPDYKSSKPSVASIDKLGMIITLKPGKTTITVTAGPLVKRFTLTVVDMP